MTPLELHDRVCAGANCGAHGAIDQPGQGVTAAVAVAADPRGTPAPADPADRWAHLRGLSPLEQWNEDGNR